MWIGESLFSFFDVTNRLILKRSCVSMVCLSFSLKSLCQTLQNKNKTKKGEIFIFVYSVSIAFIQFISYPNLNSTFRVKNLKSELILVVWEDSKLLNSNKLKLLSIRSPNLLNINNFEYVCTLDTGINEGYVYYFLKNSKMIAMPRLM